MGTAINHQAESVNAPRSPEQRRSRVLVFNHFAVPRSASGGTRHVELFGRLKKWDALVVAAGRSLQGGQKLESDELLRVVPTTPFTGSQGARVLNWVSYAASSFVRGLFTPKPTVIWGSSPHLPAAATAAILARLRGAKLVVEVRDLWPQILVEWGMLSKDDRTYRALKSLELWLYRRADRIVALAEGTADILADDGVDPAKVVFIPNGAEPVDFAVDEDRDSLRSKLGFSAFTVLYAGAMGPANGLDFALDAAQRLASDTEIGIDTPVEFVLIGDGGDRNRLAARISDEKIANVRILEPVPKAEIARYLKAADVGLHCLADVALFRHGVSPNKVYDYMAAGLPVLTNTPGVVGDMVTSAGAGVAVEPDALDEGVRRMLVMSGDDRARCGHSGIAFMEGHRSRSILAARLEQMLDELAASG